MLGQRTAQTGTLILNGISTIELARVGPSTWSNGLLQDFIKLQGNLADSVRVAGDADADRGDVERALRDAHALKFVLALPEGMESRVGLAYDGVDLSHGQWQRLAFARGLIRGTPDLWVLDEPTSALDPEVEHALVQTFRARAREAAATGTISVVVSHRLSTVMDADVIWLMRDGRLVEHGTHRELMALDGEYAEVFLIQQESYS